MIPAEYAADTVAFDANTVMLVTMRIDNQMFGIPVHHVRDVLREQKVARIPLASPEIEGSINLRGRIVTVINLRKRLRLPDSNEQGKRMFVVVEHAGELFSLMVDNVGDVITIPEDDIERVPANMSESWREAASGVHRMTDGLLVVMDIQSILNITA